MFASSPVNHGRQPEIDIARGLAVLFMIMIHVQLYFANSEALDTYLADVIDFTGDIPAAPMFMFLLGVGINYSRNHDPALMARRGLGLFAVGYLLSYVRGFLPNAIHAYQAADIRYFYLGLNELMFVDILQFAGLAMLAIALLNRVKASRLVMLGIVLLLSVMNYYLLPFKTDSLPLSSLAGLLWGSNENSFFPFLTWFFYPVAGYVFGDYLIRCDNKRRFYQVAGLISAIVFFGGIFLFNIYLRFPTGMTSEYGYYHHRLTDNITFTAGVVLELSLLSLVTGAVPAVIQSTASRWSKNVTPIYCIHWVLITWLSLVVPMKSLEMNEVLLLVLAMVVLSDLLAMAYTRWKTSLPGSVFSPVNLILSCSLLAFMLAVVVVH